MDWFVWRVVTDPRISVGLLELGTAWSLDDLLDAHEALDVRDHLEALARAPTPRE